VAPIPNPCRLEPIASPWRFERFQALARSARGNPDAYGEWRMVGVPIRHSLLTIRLIVSMRNLSEREKLTMTHFDIFKKKNHRLFNFKLWRHSRSALVATHPEPAREGIG
jgi:hypothetical protein